MVDLNPKDAIVELGENLTLTCVITGQLNGDVLVTWSRNNDEISSMLEMFVQGRTLTTQYVMYDITMEDKGSYTCSVHQNNCTSSSSIRVSMQEGEFLIENSQNCFCTVCAYIFCLQVRNINISLF